MNYELLIFLPIFIFLINLFFKYNKFAPSYSGDKHQKYVEKKSIPLSGGFIIITTSLFLFYENNHIYAAALSMIFLIGFLSDLNLLSSPKTRFILQTITILFFVYLSKLNVGSTKIYFIDFLLENIFLSIFFTTFCLMIVVNGSNFIDGLNGMVLGYYLIVLLIIFDLNIYEKKYIQDYKIILFITLIGYLLLFNFFNQLYVGDGGAYILGFTCGYFLIAYYQNNNWISPYFVILLLWYPCFENLFSIIRKRLYNNSPLKPDSKHFHQLLFFFISKKFKYKNIYVNNYSSLIILFYNGSILFLGSQNTQSTKFQILLILINILVYIFFYIHLHKFRKRFKSS